VEIIQDNLWLCTDCLIYAVNGDTSGIESPEREREVVEGVNALGPHLVPDYDVETEDGILGFTRRQCDACGTRLAGERHRFAILGEERRRPRGSEYEPDDYCEENPVLFGLSGTELLLVAGGVGLVGLVGYLIYNANWSSGAQGAAAWVAGQGATSPQLSVAASETGAAPTASVDPSPNFCTNVGAVQGGSMPSPAGGQTGYCWQDSGNTSVPAVGQYVAVMIYEYESGQGTPITPQLYPYFGTVTAVDSNNNVTIAWEGTPNYTETFPLSYVNTGLQLVGAAAGVSPLG
jgi:hypothetical protein